MALITSFSGGFAGYTSVSKAGPPAPTYAVSPAANNVNEGSSLTFNVITTNVSNSTTLYWSLSRPSDFSTSNGSFVINNNTGSFTVTPTADETLEGAETFTVSIRTGSISGTIVANSSSVTINDTSVPETDPYWSTVKLAVVGSGSNNSTTITDSKVGYTATRSGTFNIRTNNFKFGTGSVYGAGASSYGYFDLGANTFSMSGSNSFTFEYWMYCASAPSTIELFGIGSAANTYSDFWMAYSGSLGRLNVRAGGASNFRVFADYTHTLAQNAWVHYAFVKNGSTAQLYINGNLTLSNSALNTGSTFIETGKVVKLAYYNTIPNSFGWGPGIYVDDLRLTASARYTSNFTPRTSQIPLG